MSHGPAPFGRLAIDAALDRLRAGDVDAVWESGYFAPTTSTVAGYPIIGYVSPTGWTGFAPDARPSALSKAALARLIASQDGGR